MREKIVLIGIAAVLAGCGAGSGLTSIPPSEYPYYQNYLDKRPHYKAYARATDLDTDGYAIFWVFGAFTPERAASRAMDGCKQQIKNDPDHKPCQLHSLGNVNVSRLDAQELSQAMAAYKKRRDFILSDLKPGAPERPIVPQPVRVVQPAAPHTGSYCYRVGSNEMFELRGPACASDAFEVTAAEHRTWRASKTEFKTAFEEEQGAQPKE